MRACYVCPPSAFWNHRARWGHSFPGLPFFLRGNWWTLDSSVLLTSWKYSQTCHKDPQSSRWNTRADTLRTMVHWHTSRSITAFFPSPFDPTLFSTKDAQDHSIASDSNRSFFAPLFHDIVRSLAHINNRKQSSFQGNGSCLIKILHSRLMACVVTCS